VTDDHRAEVPGLSRRLACMLYDGLLLLAVLFVAFLLPQSALSVALGRALPGRVMWGHLILVSVVYFLWFWTHGGQTLAMKTWKIRLVKADLGAPTLSQLLLRFTLVWPGILVLGVGILWALIDRDGQFLHDRIAGTRLVRV
jgi:uncharacterized RDD family membrane protein YckC